MLRAHSVTETHTSEITGRTQALQQSWGKRSARGVPEGVPTVGMAWWSLQVFLSDATGQCLRAIYGANTTSSVQSRTGPGPWQLGAAVAVSGCSSSCEMFSCATSPLRCHFTAQLKHLPHALTEVLLSVIHRAATLKNYKTSSEVELTALPSLVLENVTGHVFQDTSKIAFKPSNSYQSLIFHDIPPNKLIPAFRILCLRRPYPFPTHPDQPLHSELTPNPSPNTLLLPDHFSQPFFHPSLTIFNT